MQKKVSIIMISHNKYPQNLYSLYALQKQTFDLRKMEVILVDDASSDLTPKLSKYRPPFKFQYIRCNENVGRSKAKNIGIEASTGEVLIFIDAEMILDPGYVEQHYNLHQLDHNLVITGCLSHYNTFTVYDKRYNPEQKKLFRSLYYKKNKRIFKLSRQYRKKLKVRLFKKASIFQGRYKKYAYPSPFFSHIIERFGPRYEGYKLPYIFVITHNISVRREILETAGYFDEGFQGWGCEDWEFGYRLHKLGVKIVDHPMVKVYHQEHPRSMTHQNKDSLINYRYFYTLHPEFDVGVQALCWIGKNLLEVNDYVLEYETLHQNFPGMFRRIAEACHIMFMNIFQLLIQDMPVANLRQYSDRMQDEQWYLELIHEISNIPKSGQYDRLNEMMVWLINK